MKLLEAVRQVQKNLYEGKIGKYGICANVDSCIIEGQGSCGKEFKAAVKTWKHFSGDYDYPVPGGERAYDAAWGKDDMWSKTKRYGRLRRSLLSHLVKKLKERK